MMKKKTAKILIVDDEPGMRHMVLDILKPEGYQLSSAEDGVRALEMAKNERPNLILLDVRLPGMDGFEILAEIKKTIPETTVIMVSGSGDVESAIVAMKQGAFDYISKPFRVDELLNRVGKALDTQTLSKDRMIRKHSAAATAGPPGIPPAAVPGRKSNMLKYILITVALVGICGGIGFGVFTFFSSQVTYDVFAIPYSSPTSIAFDGTYLWVTDRVTQSFYQHNTDKMLSMARRYYIQNSHPTAVAFDGQNLWSSNARESLIFKHRPDETLSIIETYQTPGPEPSGLYWDGVYLWICDMGQAKIYQTKITGQGLATVNVFDSPGNSPVGIFFDGQHYFIGDSETNHIYKLSRNFSVLGVFVVPQFETKENRLSAIGWDGSSIWTCSDESQKVYRNSFKSLKKLIF